MLDSSLAFAGARSVEPEDLVPTYLVCPDRVGETYSVSYNPGHRWFHLPEMQTGEVLLIKCFDWKKDGRGRFAAHTAFIDPTTPPNASPRESIELRALVFHDPQDNWSGLGMRISAPPDWMVARRMGMN